MLKRSYVLLNLDTGEEFSLSRSLTCDPKAICEEIEQDNMMCLSDLWSNAMSEDLKKNPEKILNLLQGLSTFLIASRGHRLILVDSEVMDKILNDIYEDLGLQDKLFENAIRYDFKKEICAFIKRRWKNLKDPLEDTSQDEGFINTQAIDDIKQLFKRKIKDKGLNYISDYDEEDYKDIKGFKL